MGLQIELYFKGSDMKTLMDNNPDSVIITMESERISPTNVILKAQAIGYDKNSKQVGTPSTGCPTPCHFTGDDANCLNEAEELLNYYVSNYY